MTTLWLANTASLLLPVSNLTNLLALHHFARLGVGHCRLHPRLAALPGRGRDRRHASSCSSCCTAGPARPLRARRPARAARPVHARRSGAAVCVAARAGLRQRGSPRPSSPRLRPWCSSGWSGAGAADARGRVTVPWLMVARRRVLFVVVDAAGRHGLQRAAHPGRRGTAPGRTCCGSAASARWPPTRSTTCPAYLALEPVASRPPAADGPAHRRQLRAPGDDLGLAGDPPVGERCRRATCRSPSSPSPGRVRSAPPRRSVPPWRHSPAAPCCRSATTTGHRSADRTHWAARIGH